MRVQENIIFHHEFILAPTVENKAKYDKMHWTSAESVPRK